MKILLFGTAFFFSTLIFAQSNEIEIKTIQKSLAKTNEQLYASKYEVSNQQYNAFLNDLIRSQELSKYKIAEVDSTNWTRIYQFGEPFMTHYHRHPAYANYPVVNVSYEGAALFCEWLTEKYNSVPNRKFKKVVFRLPTEREWITAAKGGDDSAVYPWKGNDLTNKKNQPNCNWRSNLFVDNADITTTVKCYTPNAYGLYNMSGNVAEMIAEKGFTKGGSYRDGEEKMTIASIDDYGGIGNPNVAIGFRYFMEVIEH